MLITGTILRNSLYLLPWLFGEGICLVVSIVMALLKVVELFVEQVNIANGIGFIFFVLIITGELNSSLKLIQMLITKSFRSRNLFILVCLLAIPSAQGRKPYSAASAK